MIAEERLFYTTVTPNTRDNVYDEAWYQRDKMMENKKYPVSIDEYIPIVQENFKREYPTFEQYFDMLNDERVINVIKEGYDTDCWYYDNDRVEGYFDINNPLLGNGIFQALELAVEFPEYLD